MRLPLELLAFEPRVLLSLSVDLAAARALDALAYRRRRLAGPSPFQLARIQRRRIHVQVDAIHKRSGDAHAVTRHEIGRAVTPSRVMPEVTAGAGVHRRHELEARGKIHLRCGARDRDASRFEGFAQHLKHVPAELRKLVEEKYPVVRERDLART